MTSEPPGSVQGWSEIQLPPSTAAALTCASWSGPGLAANGEPGNNSWRKPDALNDCKRGSSANSSRSDDRVNVIPEDSTSALTAADDTDVAMRKPNRGMGASIQE